MTMSTTPDAAAGPGSRRKQLAIPAVLIALAAAGWWWSARMADDAAMPSHPMDMATTGAMSFGAFLLAWLAMMTAMMFPAVAPVVRLYARGAAADRIAPLPFFVTGYIGTWTALGVPAYFAWQALMEPIADGRRWAALLAGGVMMLAALWQLTPLKTVCLRHCRSPMSVFLRFGRSAEHPFGAARMGATHGAYCIGCCWALMAVLIALGTMNLAWMLGLACLILLEKNAPSGERIAKGGAVLLAVTGLMLLIRPETLSALT
jgi:predicted metal-binding membrane protein